MGKIQFSLLMGKHIIIIGGGLAGLSAGVLLADKGYKITLLEASPKLGGRAYSFFDQNSNLTIDNGQHLLMGCYRYTLKFISVLGTQDKLDVIKGLTIPFVDSDGKVYTLQTGYTGYPFNLTTALLKFEYLSLSERTSLIKLIARLKVTDTSKLNNLSVYDWLLKNGQSEKTIRSVWEILTVGTLNTSMEKASAESFAKVLKEIFLTGKNSFNMIIPRTGLSDLFCNEAAKKIENSGTINLSEKVEKIVFNGNSATELLTNSGSYKNFDYIISAVPGHALQNLMPGVIEKQYISPEYSPILSAHVKLDTTRFKQPYYSFINSPVQWVFKHADHISIVISNAENLITEKKEDVKNLIFDELEKHFPFFKRSVAEYVMIVKEKRATFVPSPGYEKIRKKFNPSYNNLFFAGDWANTGLPSTIESAVKSGFSAAGKIISAND